MSEALKLAVKFHETYERLAPDFGYETRKETRDLTKPATNTAEAEALMVCWFANAIMAGFDTANMLAGTRFNDMKTALRSYVVTRATLSTTSGRAKGYMCTRCNRGWYEGENENHADDCLAAP